jgi:phosphate transport system permease protein
VATNVEALREGGPGIPARPLVVTKTRTRRRILADRVASRVVVLGGLVVIASVLAILVVIVAEVWPLFRPPSASRLASADFATGLAPGRAAGVDEYREIAYAVSEDGTLRFLPLRVPGGYRPVPVTGLDGARITATAALAPGRLLLGTSDGRVIPLEVKFDIVFAEGKRILTPAHQFGEVRLLDGADKRRVIRLAGAAPQAGPLTLGQVGPRTLVVQRVVETKALVGAGTRRVATEQLDVPTAAEVTAFAVDGRADDLFVGTAQGQILRYDLRGSGAVAVTETVETGERAAITALDFLVGDRTLVVGTGTGRVTTWQVVPEHPGGQPRLRRVHEFQRHAAPVVASAVSQRDKGFVTADAGGGIHVNYGTTGTTLLSLQQGTPGVSALVFAPKADGVLALDGRGRTTHWRLDNPHPEITLKSLFAPVWYEGYTGPAYVWQSTGGSDDFEAKLSLTPLLYGTLKGTFYALLIAVPLALLAALYASEFMHPGIKAYVKPVVEIMAALPSVVLGFLAGLWLAPAIERIVPGLFVFPLVLTVAVLVALLAWRTLPRALRGRVRAGTEVFLLVPVVVLAAWMAFALGGLLEARLLAGDYRGWLLSALGLTYDQRNSLVVGVAMGFAVIPIIFTIAEDSLANVPQHLRAGSLALGATRWQTALRVVLPTASPGIFSAIMIGFGRAVGETMIVLMATGNTPVMDWSIFSGFRALSANIAVELPEAPEGGTLFRVLFLAALLLFFLTFAVNTVAEVVRLRLRRRYRYL